MKRRAIAATIVLLAACGGAAVAPTKPSQAVSSSSPPVASPEPLASASSSAAEAPALDEKQAAELVAAMLKRVEKARHLQAKHPVASKTLDRATLIAQVKAHVEREVPADAMKGQGEMLVALGLIPPTYDFVQGVFDLLKAQLAGYYEPADKTMYLASDLGKDDAEATLAHELVHALQDQYWDIGPQIEYHEDAGDRGGAVHALAEGDAMSAMLDVIFAGKGSSGTAIDLPDDVMAFQMRAQMMIAPGIAEVPPVLKSSLIAPYIDGMLFVNRLRRDGGWSAVDGAWKRPPVTTEQLLHPDKYAKNEPALAVPGPITDLLGGGFRVLYSDLFGEQGVRLVFEEWASRSQATKPAEGWGGDRATVLVRQKGDDGERMLTWWMKFDGAGAKCPEAVEAFEVTKRGVAPDARHDRAATVCRERSDLGPIAAGRRGCDVLIAAGPYARRKDGQPSGKATCAEVEGWVAKALGQR